MKIGSKNTQSLNFTIDWSASAVFASIGNKMDFVEYIFCGLKIDSEKIRYQ